jgi:PPOX class probable F420-dependent enzyme
MASVTAFSLLNGHQFMNLTTYRKNGEESTRPVWFVDSGEALFIFTTADSWKIKHIQKRPEVWVSPSDSRGTPLSTERAQGMGKVHAKGSERARYGNQLLNKKYGWMKWMFNLTYWVSRRPYVILEIQPS